jgi:hypothetical protein
LSFGQGVLGSLKQRFACGCGSGYSVDIVFLPFKNALHYALSHLSVFRRSVLDNCDVLDLVVRDCHLYFVVKAPLGVVARVFAVFNLWEINMVDRHSTDSRICATKHCSQANKKEQDTKVFHTAS